MKTIIIQQVEGEDLEVHVQRRGRRVVITTERPGVARAIERQLINSMSPRVNQPVIGFQAEE